MSMTIPISLFRRKVTIVPPEPPGGPVAVSYITGASNFNGVTTGSFTPTNDSLLVVIATVGGSGGGTQDLATALGISGGSLSWTRRVVVPSHSSDGGAGGAFWRGSVIWTAPVATGASMTVQITGTEALDVAVFEATGHDVADPVVRTAVFYDDYNEQSSGADSFSMGATTDANGAVIAGMIAEDYSGGPNVTPGDTWTESRNVEYANYERQYQFILGSVSAASWTFPNGFGWGWGGIAIEIRSA